MTKFYKAFLFLVLLTFSSLYSQKQNPNRHLEIYPDGRHFLMNNQTQTIQKSSRIYPTAFYNPEFSSTLSSPEDQAWEYLEKQGYKMGIKNPQLQLRLTHSRESRSGYRLRFEQVHAGYPVYEASVVISINFNNEVVFVANGFVPDISLNDEIKITNEQAVAVAKNHLQIGGAPLQNLKSDWIVFSHDGQSRLVRQVKFIGGKERPGDWEFLVDAESGNIIQALDKACYFETGQGWVFDPDPITRSGASYGSPGFSDNNDADSPQLTEQLVQVELSDITLEEGLFRLESPYTSIVDYEEPYTGLHEQSNSDFFFTRSQDGFEATNVFYHIDRSMRYINDTLAIPLMPYHYDGGVQFDPHGLEGSDNSWYTSAGYVAFGDGGVADGEDHDVIVHELGHGLHDWVTLGGLSQVDGLSEGCGDYWAQSYKRAKGFVDPAAESYNWVFSWDGHNPFWDGRTTGYNAVYPAGLVGQIHTDGQMWASSLMQIYDRIGRFATDVNFLEGLSMLNEKSSQRDAAFAFIQADKDNFDGEHLDDIVDVFTQRGYITDPVTVFFDSDITGGPPGLQVNFSDKSFSYPDDVIMWEWDFNNDGVIDAFDKNPMHIYNQPGLYTVSLTASDGVNISVDSLVDFISVNAGVYVWEGTKDSRDNSGRYIFNTLQKWGIPSVYSRSDIIPSSLLGYDAVFLSFGNVGSNRATFSIKMADAVQEYLENGGNVYVDGADALGDDQAANQSLLTLMGIDSVDDGISSRSPVSDLRGRANTIFENLHFLESNQQADFSIDRFVPNENGIVAFTESDSNNVALQGEGLFGQKSIAFSYALSELADVKIPSTREDILAKVLQFFEIHLPMQARFAGSIYSGHAPLEVNFKDFSFYDINDATLQWNWDFNNDGVTDSQEENPVYTYSDPGRYAVKLTLQNDSTQVDTTIQDFVRVFNGESALNFSESENYAEAEADTTLNISNAYTIELWMKPASWGTLKSGQARVFDKGNIRLFLWGEASGNYNAESIILFMRHEGGKTSTYGTPDSSIKLNQWQHVIAAYDGVTNNLKMYINGELVELTQITNEAAGPVLDNKSTALVLGESITKSRPYSGVLDEVRIWEYARSDFQIKNHWNHYVDASLPGLQAYWKFNEANGDSLIDNTVNGHHALITGADWVEGVSDLMPVGISENDESIRLNKFVLYENYPNPFNPVTTIKFQIPVNMHTQLIIYDALGREVKNLVDKPLAAGIYTERWDGTNNLNNYVASGIYFYRITAKSKGQKTLSDHKKMLLIR